MNTYRFPQGFRWGSATSAHQIEGDSHNDWSEWEKSPKRTAELKAKGLKPEDFISGRACDSYHRYEEDFDIAKKLNHNIHRLSIEWSRIEPEEGRFNEKEMQHYINVVKVLRDRGIEPMITLWHFTNPIWFAEKGGFLNRKSPEYFVRYVKYVAENLKDQVGLWITFNEATTVYSGHSYIKGLWPPGHRSLLEGMRVNRNIVRSHILAYKMIKNLYSHSPVNFNNKDDQNSQDSSPHRSQGAMSHNVVPHSDQSCGSGTGVMIGLTENNAYVVLGKNLIKQLIGNIYNFYRNLYFLTKAFPHYDFIGLNYYNIDRKVFKNFDVLSKQARVEEMGWELYPEGLFYLLRQLKKFKKPVYITENGIADKNDKLRIKFIKDHLYWTWRAIQDGVDIRGYLYWSLLDNFEWHHGFSPRFGLVEIDYNTLERHIRPSAIEYGKICLTNQLEVD